MRLRLLLRALGLLLTLWLGAVGPAAAQAADGLRLDLNIPAQRLVVYDGERVLRTYPVSVGKPGHDTPTGEYTIDHAEWNPWWRPPAREWAKDKKITPPGPDNPMGRVKLFFAPLYFLHGTPEQGSIGTPASHGCVRLLNRDAVALARLLHERAQPTLAPAQIDALLKSGRTRQSRFGAPARLVIRYQPVVVRGDTLTIYPDVYRYRAVHGEAVYQALLQAGYDAATIRPTEVKRVLERARAAKGTWSVALREAFGADLAQAPPPR